MLLHGINQYEVTISFLIKSLVHLFSYILSFNFQFNYSALHLNCLTNYCYTNVSILSESSKITACIL
jgi:hypothetical protein